MPEGWQRNLKLVKAGLDWLNAQSFGVQLAAVCVGVIILMTGILMLFRVLGWLWHSMHRLVAWAECSCRGSGGGSP